jgi:hypothetical protein
MACAKKEEFAMRYLAAFLAATAGLLAVALASAQLAPAPGTPTTPLPVTPGFNSTVPPAAAVVRPLPPSQWTAAQILRVRGQ